MGQLTFHSDSTQSTPVSRPNLEPEYSPVSFLLVVAPPPPSTSGAAAPHAHADRSEGERGERKRDGWEANRGWGPHPRRRRGRRGPRGWLRAQAPRRHGSACRPPHRPRQASMPHPPLLRTLNPNPIQAEIPFLSRYLLGF
jgi:hypothetical protein